MIQRLKITKNVSIELSTNFLVYKQLADKSKQTANKCKQIAETKVSLYQKWDFLDDF